MVIFHHMTTIEHVKDIKDINLQTKELGCN